MQVLISTAKVAEDTEYSGIFCKCHDHWHYHLPSVLWHCWLGIRRVSSQ